MSRFVLASCALSLGYASAQVAPSPTSSRPATATPSSASADTAVPAVPVATKQALSPGVEALRILVLDVAQVLAVPVSAIALGEGTRVAVLGDPPQVGDARGLKPLPLPPGLRAKPFEVDSAGIFFGRDNEPRIMGVRRGNGAESATYWRHTAAGWRDGREEIGQLGGTLHGGLWGVLGADDPELVCRSNAICIIKRSSGWQTAPAGSSARLVNLQDGVLWGLDASGLAASMSTAGHSQFERPRGPNQARFGRRELKLG